VLQDAALSAEEIAQHHAAGQRPAEDLGDRGRALGHRQALADAGRQLAGQLGQPLPQEAVQQFEQHRLAGLEVPQHVRLGQAHPAAELVEGDRGHRHLVEHRRCHVEDRPAADLTLLLGPRPLKSHDPSLT
jgi:hypothetical protein